MKEADKDKDKESEKDKETQEAPALDLKPAKEYRLSSNVWGRGKGNVYLIDVRTRQVLWSTYRRPKSFDASEMDSTAAKIVSRLQQDLKGAK